MPPAALKNLENFNARRAAVLTRQENWRYKESGNYKSHAEILEQAGMRTIANVLAGVRLRFYGHVCRDEDTLTSAAIAEDRETKGRWTAQIDEDLEEAGTTLAEFVERAKKKVQRRKGKLVLTAAQKEEQEAQLQQWRQEAEQKAKEVEKAVEKLRGTKWTFKRGKVKVDDRLLDCSINFSENIGDDTYFVGGHTFVKTRQGIFIPLREFAMQAGA